MVSNKSVYYGRFDGIEHPVIPKARRTLRVESDRKSSEGSKLCAFDLLADVAEKLLHESQSSTSSIVKREEDEVKVKDVDQGSCVESESTTVISNLKRKLDSPLKDLPESENDSGLEHVSDVKTFDFLETIESNAKMEAVEEQSGELALRLDNSVRNKSDSNRGDINVKTGITDDDYNSIRFNHRDTKIRTFRSRSRVGYRRIRKMLSSRYSKVPSVYEVANLTHGGVKSRYQNRKNMYKRERYQLEAASKRRKLFHQSLKNEKNGNGNKMHPRAASKKVKFSINSFKVPEMYVEIPETATVGSLKMSVINALKAILGGELHVGILLEGKKVRDNNRTLQQTGINHNSDLETLGFILEPSFSLDCPSPIKKELPLSIASPIADVRYSNSCLDHHPATSLDNHTDKNQEIIPLHTEVLTEEREADSKALSPVADVKTEAVSDIPVNNRNLGKKYEISQRRIRRPFSVSEVEALVEAVETHGPGRWREVKLCSFNEADHRTYVDLKDKWKTLVHTASISPLQRRGQPVPHHLLDRVLAAHEFWSNNQTKKSWKQKSEPLRIMGNC